MLKGKGLATGLGDEGGFAPSLPANRDALDLIATAVEQAGFTLGTDIALALDVAATEFYTEGGYRFEGAQRGSDEMIEYYAGLVDAFPLVSIEDPLAEDDWEGWKAITAALGDRVQIVGDDLFVTNPDPPAAGHRRGRGERAAREGQPDRHAHRDARRRRPRPPQRLPHDDEPPLRRDRGHHDRRPRGRRGLRSDQDGRARPGRERVAKYNQLLRIEEELDDAARLRRGVGLPALRRG